MTHRFARRGSAIAVLVLIASSMLAQPRITFDAGGSLAAHLRNTDVLDSAYFTAVEELSLYGVARHKTGQITMEYGLGLTGRRDSRRRFTEYSFAQNFLASVELTAASFLLSNRGFPGTTGELSLELGRRRFTDPTTLIIDGIADGASVVFDWPRITASLDVAYTGLNSKHTETKPRLLSIVTIGTPAVIARQDVALFGAYRRDLDRTGSDGGYAGLRVNGPIVPHLFHTTSISTMFAADEAIALLGSLSLRYYLDRAYLSRFVVETTYASGEGSLSRFIPVHDGRFREKEIGFDADFPDRVVTELAYSVRPFVASAATWLSGTELGLSSVSFFRTTDAAAPEFPGNPAGAYLGSRVLATAILRASSDFGVDARIGAFFPTSPGTDDHDRRRGFFSTSVFVLF